MDAITITGKIKLNIVTAKLIARSDMQSNAHLNDLFSFFIDCCWELFVAKK